MKKQVARLRDAGHHIQTKIGKAEKVHNRRKRRSI
jgi:predicted metalloprotease